MSIFNRGKKEAARIRQIQEDQRAREKSAIWANAVVVGSDYPAMASGGLPCRIVNLILKVTPPDEKPYTSRTSWKVQTGSLELLNPGSEISVKIDALNPEIVYPNIQGAEFIVDY